MESFQYLLDEHRAWPSGFINLCMGILCHEALEKNYNFLFEPVVEYSSEEKNISDSKEHILIIKYMSDDPSFSPK